MVWPALIAAGASLAAGAMGNSAQASANRKNIALARENRDWEEKMSNTSYQRAVKDLQMAGLNPMLAYSQGGASSPTHTAATVHPVDSMAKAVATAGEKAMQAQQLENMRLQNQILVEKREQEIVNTHVMQEQNPIGERGRASIEMEQLSANVRRTLAQADIAEIERAIAMETKDANVSSAKAMANLKDQEVTMAQLRTILMRLEIPEKEAMARWFETIGAASPAAKSIMSISQWLKFILGK